MTSRRAGCTAVITVLVALAAACAPAPVPGPGSTIPTTWSTTTTSSTTTTTAVPLPASIGVVLAQPSHGNGTLVIGGQSAPLDYVLTVTNAGDEPSGPIVVTDTLDGKTTLVADSASCGATPGCNVATTSRSGSQGEGIAWSIGDVAPRTSHELTVSATVDSLAVNMSMKNLGFATNVNTPNCATPTCASNVVTNPVEPFGFKSGGGFWPRNSVWYSGPTPEFSAAGWELNDPDADIISYEWTCYPDSLCDVNTPNEPSTTMLFHWDFDDHYFWAVRLLVTAERGDETISAENWMYFNIEYGSCRESTPTGSHTVPCPWDVNGQYGW